MFNYNEAFSRNLGIVSEDEQVKLKNARIGIAGLGGVGGSHILTHARMGIANFNIADMDIFEIQNFNRQAGALCSTINRSKVDVMKEMVLDINPEANINIFPNGLSDDNLDQFLEGVDVLIDGLDFFVFDIRQKMHKRAREKKIPVIAAGPIGCGVSLTIYTPDSMSWDDFFGVSLIKEEIDKTILFYLGNSPTGIHQSYIDSSRIKLEEKKGPSIAPAVQLCSGFAAIESMKLILKRGTVLPVPYFHQFDVYKNKYICKRLPFGNRGVIQRLKLFLIRRKIKQMQNLTKPELD